MKTIQIQGETGSSRILIGESLRNIAEYVPQNRGVIITDANVQNHYQWQFPAFPVIEIGTGEEIKTLDTVQSIYEHLMDYELDRSSFLLGIGGGIVCDIAGFVASTYMRGLRFGFAATTLLAQVDAGTGGKNGVNLGGYKNIIGVFSQPEFVICDLELLSTLPKAEISCGFAEIVKHAVIKNKDMFAYIEQNYEKALHLDAVVMEKLIHDSLLIKTKIVSKDEREKGERRTLNFGHTFAHAIEKIYKKTHGEAVSIGMTAACRLSVKKGYLSETEAERIRRLLEKLNLPTDIRMDRRKILDAVKRDKKKEGNFIYFVLIKGIGEAVVEAITFGELEDIF